MTKSSTTDLALLAMRTMLGTVFVYHGAQKLFGLFGGYGVAGTAGWMESVGIPFPLPSAIAAGVAELVGGLAFLSGFAQRLIAVPLAFTMVIAVVVTSRAGFAVQAGGAEYPLTLLIFVIGLGLLGPGNFALTRTSRSLPL